MFAFLSQLGPEWLAVGAATVAIVISVWQTRENRRAVRAQTFVSLLSLESQQSFQRGVKAIAKLHPYASYAEYITDESVTDSVRQDIYDTVVFLNYMAVLGEEKYLKIQDTWDIGFQAFHLCKEKLLPWWLEGERESHPRVFPSFQRACRVIGAITPEAMDKFEAKINRRYRWLYFWAAPNLGWRKIRRLVSTTQGKPN